MYDWSNEDYLILVGYYDYDISWTNDLKLPYIIYYKDRIDKEPFSAVNKGKGETNTLKFIADFYDVLPKNLIQVHQYDKKNYHVGSLMDILNDPQLETKYLASITSGYWSFNKFILGSIEEQIPRMLASGWWENCMLPYFGSIDSCGDFTRGKIGCSQFIVSRDRIRSLPRSFYQNMYQWLITNTLDEEATDYDPITLIRKNTKNRNHPNSNYYTSRYMEWTWELIFTSWKSSDKPTKFLSDGRSILILYGYGNYYRDVTTNFMKTLIIKDDKLIFPNCKFNNNFFDSVHGYEKTLKIIIDDKIIEIDEKYNILL